MRLEQECIDKDSTVEKIQQIFDEFSRKYGFYNIEKERNEKQLISKSEELHAALSELSEVRSSLSSLENKYSDLQKNYDRLSVENVELEKELDEIRSEVMERRRKSITRKSLDMIQFVNTRIKIDECEDENMGLVVLEQLLQKIDTLKKENQNLIISLENERAEHKALQRDLHVAVQVAERGREEAEAEVARFMEASKYSSADSEQWTELMKKYDKNSKRNALLAWTQSHLVAYPSLSVTNFSSDWTGGQTLCALIHSIRPDLIDRAELGQGDCTQLAVKRAGELGIEINPEIFMTSSPDWKHIMAIVFELYKKYDYIRKNVGCNLNT
ncbi:hypothetical protein DICVIV_02979 [Dictyocaulus viviparus]|uniref:Calponin-homology (CH) domain-containing protein n=1 Tax=Dictyocaulus viviparus TaxID=29172 RepID=A0A0D8Y4A7_DICVI|nr:hypothetical protein DICVIV_02979 [Dictyocaulus viviparus]